MRNRNVQRALKKAHTLQSASQALLEVSRIKSCDLETAYNQFFYSNIKSEFSLNQLVEYIKGGKQDVDKN